MYLRKKPLLANVLSFPMPRLASARFFRLRHIVPTRDNSGLLRPETFFTRLFFFFF